MSIVHHTGKEEEMMEKERERLTTAEGEVWRHWLACKEYEKIASAKPTYANLCGGCVFYKRKDPWFGDCVYSAGEE